MSTGIKSIYSGRRTQFLGWSVITAFILLLVFGLGVSPEDDTQGEAVRLFYIHVPVAIASYVCYTICAIASLAFLIKKTLWWDYLALSTAEIGTIFSGLTLVTGVIWGRPIWNTWWEWGDVRLVTVLILFLLFVGYLALRAMPTQNPITNAKRAAVVALVAVVDIPIINRSVEWWQDRTLHQRSTFTDFDDGLRIRDFQLFSVALGGLAFGLLIIWLVLMRFRVLWLAGEAEKISIQRALERRITEGKKRSEKQKAETS